MHAQGACVVVAQREGALRPREDRDRGAQHERPGGDERELVAADVGHRADGPDQDGRRLVLLRPGHGPGDQRGTQVGEPDAHQHEPDRVQALAPRQQPDRERDDAGARERQAGQRHAAQPQDERAEHGTEARPGRDPEDVGGGERVAQRRLEEGAGQAERGADHDGRLDAGQAQLLDDEDVALVAEAEDAGDRLAGGEAGGADQERDGPGDEHHEDHPGHDERLPAAPDGAQLGDGADGDGGDKCGHQAPTTFRPRATATSTGAPSSAATTPASSSERGRTSRPSTSADSSMTGPSSAPTAMIQR